MHASILFLALIAGLTLTSCSGGSADGSAGERERATGSPAGEMPPLTAHEKRIIVEKGTEPAFSGTYWDHTADGVYVCRRCGAELFRSESKFKSGTGWPSFDDAIDGAVRRQTDADGMRTELLCANCGGHLGHVFTGEEYTETNTRHCVNSASLMFTPEGEPANEEE